MSVVKVFLLALVAMMFAFPLALLTVFAIQRQAH